MIFNKLLKSSFQKKALFFGLGYYGYKQMQFNKIKLDNSKDKSEKDTIEEIITPIKETLIDQVVEPLKENIIEQVVEPIKENIKETKKILQNMDALSQDINKMIIETSDNLLNSKEFKNIEEKVNDLFSNLPKEFNFKQLLNKILNHFVTTVLDGVDMNMVLDRAKDVTLNPEIEKVAEVRIGDDINEFEKAYLLKRKQHIHKAFAKFIDVDPSLINPLDIPNIAYAGSGGGYRAMITSLGSLKSSKEMGLFDCMTYVSGVSGSCWLIYQYYSIGKQDFNFLYQHLKTRLIYDPNNLSIFSKILSTESALPLLSSLIRKTNSDVPLSLVDIFGTLLTSRLLIKDDGNIENSTLNWQDIKFSHQKEIIKDGQQPFPIYTAIRNDTEFDKNIFEWFEFTPLEVGSFELKLFIPTWSLGRKFDNGKSISNQSEIESGVYLGVFGSAFCATVAHIFDEINSNLPNNVNEWYKNLLEEYYDQMLKIHPINPISFNNPFFNLDLNNSNEILNCLVNQKYLNFMDAGMDNNLPLYPLLNDKRQIDVIIAVDASQDVKQTKWFNKTEEYAKKINYNRWPIGFDPWQQESSNNLYTSQKVKVKQIETQQEDKLILIYLPLLKNNKFNPDFDPSNQDFCSTFNFKYEPEQVELLAGLAEFNFNQNEQMIKEILKQCWLNKKKKREEKSIFNI